MRSVWVASALLICALPPGAYATGGTSSTETLVGWSDDGARYAIVRDGTPDSPEAQLEVREKVDKPGKPDKVVASFKDGDPGVPEATDNKNGVDRIDVQRWKPLVKYNLKPVAAKARARFKAEFELAQLGQRRDRYNCKNGGWSLKRKGGKPFVEVKAVKDHCFQPLGGYVHESGKRALVKLTESYDTDANDPDVARYETDDSTYFVLVDIPPK